MKSLRSYIEEGMQRLVERSSIDPETQNMLNVAKAKYPDTTDDFGALATLVRRANTHSIAGIKTLGAENDAEEADIDALEVENDIEDRAITNDEHRLDEIDAELAALRKQIATLIGKK